MKAATGRTSSQTAQHLLPCGHRDEDAQPKYAQPGVAELAVDLCQPLVGGASLRQTSAIRLCWITVHA